MNSIVILAAIPDELIPESINGINIIYTGVGKINAAYCTTKLILEQKPRLVINVGTAGVLSMENLGKVHVVRSVIERDFLAMPLAARGSVPFDHSKNEFILNDKGLKVATGDSFVTESDSWLNQQKVDLVDMELFAIAKVSNKLGVPCMAIKYGSDLANSEASIDWEKSLDIARSLLSEKIRYSLDLVGKTNIS